MNRVLQAYRFALDLTSAQEAALRSHCGGQRYAYNWGLARVKANLDQRAAERSYGIVDAELTPAVSWSAYSLRKDWNRAKHEVAPWWGENSKEAYSSGLANLARALTNWNEAQRQEQGPQGWVSPFQGQAGRCVVPVHHGIVRSGRYRSQACAATSYRHGAYARIDPQAGPACGARRGSYLFGHGVAPSGALVCVVFGGDHSH